jgi:transcriptional regulator with XRE-family HTH domain
MPTNEERAAFSKRLELALRRSPEPVHGATELALRFNLRHRGNAVSVQTAHKWLTGRAIPTKDKLATLAEWLDVNEHWLQYGPPPANSLKAAEQMAPYDALQRKPLTAKSVNEPTPEALSLAIKIQRLSPHRRYLIEELVMLLSQDVD